MKKISREKIVTHFQRNHLSLLDKLKIFVQSILILCAWPAIANLLVPTSIYYQLPSNSEHLAKVLMIIAPILLLIFLGWILYRSIFVGIKTTFFIALALLLAYAYVYNKVEDQLGHGVDDIQPIVELVRMRFELDKASKLLMDDNSLVTQELKKIQTDEQELLKGRAYILARGFEKASKDELVGLAVLPYPRISKFKEWVEKTKVSEQSVDIIADHYEVASKLQLWWWEANQFDIYNQRSSFVASIFAFWAFLIFGRVRSFLFLSVYFSAVIYGLPEKNTDIFLLLHAKFLLFTLLLKYIITLCQSNAELLRGQKIWKISKSLLLALFYAALPLCVIYGFSYAYQGEKIKLQNRAYDGYVLQEESIDRGMHIEPLLIVRNKNLERRFDRDVARTITTRISQQRRSVFETVDKNITDAKARSNSLRDQIFDFQNSYNKSIQVFLKPKLTQISSAFRLPKCEKWYHWIKRLGKCIEKSVKKPLHIAYERDRDRLVADMSIDLTEEISAVGTQAEKSLDLIGNETKNKLYKLFGKIDITLRHSWWSGLSTYQIYESLAKLIFYFYMARFIFYILSRAYWRDLDMTNIKEYLTLAPRNPLDAGSNISVRPYSDNFSIPSEQNMNYFLSPNINFRDLTLVEKTPQFFSNLGSRIRSENWHLHYYKFNRESTLKIPHVFLDDTQTIIEVEVKDKSMISFDWECFVGMTDNIQLRKAYTWSLLALLFHKNSFTYASKKPISINARLFQKYFTKDIASNSPKAYLYLITRGKLELNSDSSCIPNRLLVFDIRTRFSVIASHAVRDIYRSDIQIVPHTEDLAVFDEKDRPKNRGALSLLKRLWKY